MSNKRSAELTNKRKIKKGQLGQREWLKKTKSWICLAVLPCLVWIYWIYQFFFAQHLVVVWLQNSDEIRATGGFLGSVIRLESSGILPKNIRLHDIYDVGGGIRDYVEPPPPVKQYLAGGGAWRIQDVNWDRDFATSAKRFNDFLELAGEKPADLIVAINLSLIEKLFDQLGGVTLSNTSEQKITLTSENFALIARARRPRQDYYDFPKMDLLNIAATATKDKIIALPPDGKLALFNWLRTQICHGELQFYSPHYLLERFFAQQKIAGLLTHRARHPHTHRVYLIDSNVGINKVNRFVTRTQNLTTTETHLATATSSATIQVTWHNNCQIDPAAGLTTADCTYANYFRLLLDPDVQILFSTDTLDITTFIDSQNQNWQEIGWLIIVPPDSTVSAILNLNGIYSTWEIH